MFAARLSHCVLYCVLLNVARAALPTLSAILGAYGGVRALTPFSPSSHSASCRWWMLVAVPGMTTLFIGAAWGMFAAACLARCPSSFLRWPPKLDAQVYLRQVRDFIAEYGYKPVEPVGSPGHSLAKAVRLAKDRGLFNLSLIHI